jgi:hypothetical protein
MIFALLKNRRELGQHFIHDFGWHSFKFVRSACGKIEGAGLIAADYACGLGASARQGHGKPSRPGEAPAGCDRQHDWKLGQPVEGARRDDQDRPAALLFVAQRRIERNQVNIPAFHLQKLAAGGLCIEPFAIFRRRRRRSIALGEQLLERVPRPMLSLDDQAAIIDG